MCAGNAILAANSNWLIFVEGIEWGTNLQAVASKPVQLSKAHRVVYAVVQYSADNAPNPQISDPTFPNNMRPYWNSHFGFLVLNQIAPVSAQPAVSHAGLFSLPLTPRTPLLLLLDR